jgi:DNA replication and repair protein RecF
MVLDRFVLSAFRNIEHLDVQLHPQLNWIVGCNGSGKTSILEGIYLLGRGRSFRTSKLSTAISFHSPQMHSFGMFKDDVSGDSFTLGYAKKSQGAGQYKYNSLACSKLSDYVKHTAMTVIAPDSVQLLTGGSELRRQLVDWTVFHVEQNSIINAQRYDRALKQRNQALKQNATAKDLAAWGAELSCFGELMNAAREIWYQRLIERLKGFIAMLYPEWSLEFRWQKGWSQDCSLESAIYAVLERDKMMGFTSVGPHRADIVVLADGQPASEVLSRGQIKLLTVLLTVAQVAVQFEYTHKRGILLIDDLDAEFDLENVVKIFQFLLNQGHQLLLTSLDTVPAFKLAHETPHKMFHVKHGVVEGNISTVSRGCGKQSLQIRPQIKIPI